MRDVDDGYLVLRARGLSLAFWIMGKTQPCDAIIIVPPPDRLAL